MELHHQTLSIEEAINQLKQFDLQIKEKKDHFIGYPINAHIQLDQFFDWWAHSIASHSPLNDIGNPEQDLPYMINTRPFERDVLCRFSELLNFPQGQSWGYITTGGTLSNEQGLLLGREYLKIKGKPILYFSEDSHYSIKSTGKLLDVDFRIIRSDVYGEMDYGDLEIQLDKTRPALLNLNIGTTFKGAIDQIDQVIKILKIKNIFDYYIHADAALFGGYLPFLKDSGAPLLDFTKQNYDSIAISGHKFFGSPIPMGIFLMKKERLNRIESDFIEYISTKNMTIPCSRSSLNSLLFWWIINTKSSSEWSQEAHDLLMNAKYLHSQIELRGIKTWRNLHSNIVYFQSPKESINQKWSLAQINCPNFGYLAHVVVMQHVTREICQQFLDDFDHLHMCA